MFDVKYIVLTFVMSIDPTDITHSVHYQSPNDHSHRITSTMAPYSVTLVTFLSSLSLASASLSSPVDCTAPFTPISASDFVHQLNPGWNLGNTLDAVPDEGSWNNPRVTPGVFATIRKAGFHSVRIPVTYADHFVSGSPEWRINATWLGRVREVVEMATDAGLFVVTNMHHDSWRWADVTLTNTNQTAIDERFAASWRQIGQTLACMPSTVALEPMNEPAATTAEHGQRINDLNRLFLEALTDGRNPQRVVTLVGGGEDAVKTAEWFKRPAVNTTNPWAIQFHYYSPCKWRATSNELAKRARSEGERANRTSEASEDKKEKTSAARTNNANAGWLADNFIFGAWGKTIWGSDADKAAVVADLQALRNNFTDVPLLMGEFSASPTNCEASARWRYTDFLVRTARSVNTSVMLWDNGGDNLDRLSGVWRDPTSVSLIVDAATTEVINNLPAGTTDDSTGTSQWTSAYVFQRVGAPTTAQALPYLFKGNNITSITDGDFTLKSSDYSSNSTHLLLSATLLSRYFTTNSTAGSKANLTISFTGGAVSMPLQVVVWDVPILGQTTSVANVSGGDLSIPVTYRGLPTVAAVRLTSLNGTGLVDTWTQYLGPLQQQRATYSNQ